MKKPQARIHPHAAQRASERKAGTEELQQTVMNGEQFPAKYGRTGFRMNFPYGVRWNRKLYDTN